MTYEEKSEIVIRQLREDRDRLLDAMDKIRAEIEDYVCNHETNTDKAQGMLNALQILDKYR